MMQSETTNKAFELEYQLYTRLSNEGSCYLNGIIVIPDTGEVCVLDRYNTALKKFELNGSLIDSMALIDIPHSMCYVRREKDIAITKPDRNILEFVENTDKKFKTKKYVATNAKYFGICDLGDGLLAVSSWSQLCLDVIDMDGVIHKHIEGTGIGNTIFKSPEHVPDFLCCTKDGHIVISEINDTIVCLAAPNYESVKWERKVIGPIGDLTCDETTGEIIVCLLKAKRILSIDQEGNKMWEVPVQGLGEEHPIAARSFNSRVFFTDKSGSLFVIRLS